MVGLEGGGAQRLVALEEAVGDMTANHAKSATERLGSWPGRHVVPLQVRVEIGEQPPCDVGTRAYLGRSLFTLCRKRADGDTPRSGPTCSGASSTTRDAR